MDVTHENLHNDLLHRVIQANSLAVNPKSNQSSQLGQIFQQLKAAPVTPQIRTKAADPLNNSSASSRDDLLDRVKHQLGRYETLFDNLSATARLQADTIAVLVREKGEVALELTALRNKVAAQSAALPNALMDLMRNLEKDARELQSLANAARVPKNSDDRIEVDETKRQVCALFIEL